VRFTIRELVMLTAIVALVFGWAVDRLNTDKRMRELRWKVEYHESLKQQRIESGYVP